MQAERMQDARRWLIDSPFEIASRGFAVRRNANTARGPRRLNHTFVHIPLLQWQRHSQIFSPRGLVTVNPALVLGRRQTFMPELARGGRTFGVALEMTIRLDGAGGSTFGTDATRSGGAVLSGLRTVLDRDAR
jgi:hypothetical protein